LDVIALAVEKVAMIIPYGDAVNDFVAEYFEGRGIEFLILHSYGLEMDYAVVVMSPHIIQDSVLKHSHAEADVAHFLRGAA
jgi:maleate cis-trans isomerase